LSIIIFQQILTPIAHNVLYTTKMVE